MAYIHDEQPGLEVKSDLQPGLEVVPEPEAPHVVTGPTSQKPWNERAPEPLQYQQYQQYQQYSATSPSYDGHDQAAYSPYPHPPPSSHPGAMSDWNGTVGTSPSEKAAKAARGPTIMGIRRKKFWLIIGPLIAIFVIGVAVGLGVGLGAQRDDSSSASPSPSVVTSVICPANNGSYFDAKDNRKRFQVACNIDYHSGGGTQDMGNFQTATFEDCLNGCAANDACVGAGWGAYEGKTICWLKSHLGSTQSAPNWMFGVRQ